MISPDAGSHSGNDTSEGERFAPQQGVFRRQRRIVSLAGLLPDTRESQPGVRRHTEGHHLPFIPAVSSLMLSRPSQS